MAVTGFVFTVTLERVQNNVHRFNTLGFKDTQPDALAMVNQWINLMELSGPETTKEAEHNVVYRREGVSKAYPDERFIIQIKVMSVAEALTHILNVAKRK
jgi:hypothetical protein